MAQTSKGSGARLIQKQPQMAQADETNANRLIDAYNPRDFVIPASGLNGDAMPVSFRFQSGYDRQISILLAAKRFPYITRGDLLRHAVHRHLEYLHRLEPDVATVMPQLEAANEIMRHQQDMIRYQSTLTSLVETTDQLISLGRDAQAREMIAGVWRHLQQLEDPSWREVFMSKIVEKYSHLLPDGTGESLLG